MPSQTPERAARTRSYLMCAPDHFTVEYAINPWMDPGRSVDAALACTQWQRLCDVLRGLGHRVELAPSRPGLPDMVFTANAATVIDGRVLVATFRHRERSGESLLFEQWFRWRGYQQVRRARDANEGEGDHLLIDGVILAGHGLRTDPDSHRETSDYFGRPVVGLTLVDPRYYHLDTALAVLGGREIMYYPGAFSDESLRRLRRLFPDAIEADDGDAAVFGLNAISDGRHVVLPAAATRLAARLTERGYEPVPVELGELLKAGGGPKCCVLELRSARPLSGPGSGGPDQRSGRPTGRDHPVEIA
jgi:N-dimethylarginine dimethylaminohydrolase